MTKKSRDRRKQFRVAKNNYEDLLTLFRNNVDVKRTTLADLKNENTTDNDRSTSATIIRIGSENLC